MLSSLPSRPLTLAEIDALDRSGGATLCAPLVAFDAAEPTDEIVAIYLATDAGTRLLGYEANAGWAVLESYSETTADDLDRLAGRVIDWAEATHGADETLVVETGGTADGLVALLPARPLGKSAVRALETLPGIDHAHPLFCDADTHEIVAVLTFRGDLDDPDAFELASYGYHPRREAWTCVERSTVDDRDVDPDADVTIHDWLERHYETDDLLAIAPDS